MKKFILLLLFVSLFTTFEAKAEIIYVWVDGQLVAIDTGANPPVDDDGDIVPPWKKDQ